MNLQRFEVDDSTKRDKSKVKISQPKLFRERLVTLKDRLMTEFATEPKKKQFSQLKNKSRNNMGRVNTVFTNINNINKSRI